MTVPFDVADTSDHKKMRQSTQFLHCKRRVCCNRFLTYDILKRCPSLQSVTSNIAWLCKYMVIKKHLQYTAYLNRVRLDITKEPYNFSRVEFTRWENNGCFLSTTRLQTSQNLHKYLRQRGNHFIIICPIWQTWELFEP